MVEKIKRLLHPDDAVLLIVDIQEKFMPVIYESNRVKEKTLIMIETARLLSIPIVVTEQYPKGLGNTVSAIVQAVPSNAVILAKTAFGCAGDTAVKKYLESLNRRQVMVTGIETHVCVNQTVHQLLDAGYEPHLIEDALSSRSPDRARIGLEKMIQSGAVPSCVEIAVFELLRDATHPAFKQVHRLIK